jgi:hypothetical protein
MAEPAVTIKLKKISQIKDRLWFNSGVDKGRYWSYRNYRPNRPIDRTAIYVHVDGDEFNVWENFVNREARPYEAYKQVMPEVLARLGYGPDVRVKWSQKAGCSCPCSPGFVVVNDPKPGRDVWVTVEAGAPTVDESPDKVARRVQRAEALDRDPTIPFSLE